MSRTIAPPFGTSITSVGFLSVKSTPLLIRSPLLGMSFGVARTESVATRVLMYSISLQVLPVVVVPGAPFVVVPGAPCVVVPGAPCVVVPGAPFVVVPGAPCVVVPGAPLVVVPGAPDVEPDGRTKDSVVRTSGDDCHVIESLTLRCCSGRDTFSAGNHRQRHICWCFTIGCLGHFHDDLGYFPLWELLFW